MLTSEMVRKMAIEAGFDLCGIANIERFKDAPHDLHPATIFPEVRSVIVCAKRISRGSMRGIEEGTYWPNYNMFSYGRLNSTNGIRLWHLCKGIEKAGWEAMPLHVGATVAEFEGKPRSRSNPYNGMDVQLHIRLAAAAAGLGEPGWSKVFLTPQFGARQRFIIALTDAPLEPDPLYKDKLCTRCMRCVRDCPAGALGGQRVSVQIEDRVFEWGAVHLGRCKLCHHGLLRQAGPFIARDIAGLNIDVERQDLSWHSAFKLGRALFPLIRHHKMQSDGIGLVPVCGARGCIRSCVDELERKGVTPGFKTPFIKRPRWELEPEAHPGNELNR